MQRTNHNLYLYYYLLTNLNIIYYRHCNPKNWLLQATPTLAAAYSISRAVTVPVMCSSGLSAVTAPMALTAGAAGVVCIFVSFIL